MEGSPKKTALLELRKQIQALIAHEEAEDPAAAHEGHAEAAQSMADTGMGHDPEMTEKPAPSAAQSSFMEYMKPKVRPRRPGTGVMVDGGGHKHAGHAPEKKAPGRPRKEAF